MSEALDAGAAVESVYLAPDADDPVIQRAEERGIRLFDLAPGVMERVADTVTPQPVMAVARRLDVGLDQLRNNRLVLVCVDVRDPGNLGAVLRSAEAAGVGGVVCCDGSADVFSPKSVRASAGSLFHTPVVAGGEPLEVLVTLRSWGMRRLGTRGSGGTLYHQVDFGPATALVLGNEANGLSAGLDHQIDEWVTIPMAGRTESLNVAMAAAVLCFEAARRSDSGSPADSDTDR